MKKVGYVILSIGILWVLFALNMDTSVASLDGRRVNNLGLMAAQQNHVLIGIFVSLSGLLVVIFAHKFSPAEQYKKCTYCAESVKIDAIKCKHCGSDLLMGTDSESGPADKTTLLSGTDINMQYVMDFAASLKEKMPKAKVSSIMITYMPEINEVKGKLPSSLQKTFELKLESELLRITQK